MSSAISYHFAGYVLKTGTRELFFRGEPIRLESKVFDLIQLMVEHPDELLGKKRIADALWPGGDVSDAMISRCVYQARKALDEDASASELIKTQYGKGFYFNAADLQRIDESKQMRPDSGPSQSIAKSVETTVVNDVFPHRKSASSPLPAQQSGELTIGLMITGRLSEVPDASLIVAIKQCISQTLEKLDEVAVFCPDTEPDAFDPESADRLIAEHVLQALLIGEVSVTRDSGPVFLNSTLFYADQSASTVIGTHDLSPVDAPTDSEHRERYLEAVSHIVVDRTMACMGRAQLHPGGTLIPGAYRLYKEAIYRLSEQTEREGQIAQALLEEALEIDPGFADAWTELAWAFYENMWAAGDGRNWVTLAFKAIDTALEVEPECVSALYTKIIFTTELGNSETALALARDCLERDAEIAEFWYGKSYALRYTGQLEESNEALARSLTLNPLMLDQIGDPPIGLIYTREWSRFLELTPAYDSPYFCYYRGFALWSSGKSGAAVDELNRGIQDDPKDNFARLSRALIHIINTQYDAANSVLEKLVEQRRVLKPGDSEFTFKEARLLILAGNHSLAIERLRSAHDGGFNVVAYCETDPLFAELKQNPELQQLLTQDH